MAKKVIGEIKLQIAAGKANPSPPVGPALGQKGVNIMEFCKAFNEKTKDMMGFNIPVVITVYADRSFTFITKQPPASDLIKKAAGISKGTDNPLTNKVAKLTKAQVMEIAEIKMAKKVTKRFQELLKKIDSNKNYSVSEAISTVKTLASAKFDETVEIALKLNVDPRHADQMVRGSVILPAGTGKSVKVAVVAKDAKADEAKAAGADIVGAEDLIEDIQAGKIDFDVLIATPNMMGLVGKVGRILGPKGIMPNPKTGTVTMDVAKAVENNKGGQVNFRVDKQGNIHAGIGKVSFDEASLSENFNAFVRAINKQKPAAAKGKYIKKAALSLTMSPAIYLDSQELLDIK
ncbi:MAG: hypothetical protein B6226_06035 [Candidatus Cloacimonetes bacterium 4572_65]|nr:MAG: hypothetical protein B6226_06035 [Candidatus Cloacimonetes bacterium 4572_65]